MDRPHPVPPDLTSAILARTSGSPCARLREQACDYVDGGLAAGSRALVENHLAHCPDCAALLAALREAGAVLPALGGADPGPWFTAQVLRATVTAPVPSGFWARLMHRPRIALETAFLGTAAFFVGVALPQAEGLRSVPALVQPVGDTLCRTAARVTRPERRLAGRAERAVRSRAEQARTFGARLAGRLRGWIRPAEPPRSNPPAEPANP